MRVNNGMRVNTSKTHELLIDFGCNHHGHVVPYITMDGSVIQRSANSWNSTGKIGLIGRHLAEKPDVEVTMCFGPMRPISPVEFQLMLRY